MKDLILMILLIKWITGRCPERSALRPIVSSWTMRRWTMFTAHMSTFSFPWFKYILILAQAERAVNLPGSTMSYTKVCRDETRQLVQNIPSEECDLEPREQCKMETVLVPRLIILNRNEIFYNSIVCSRLIQKPNCIKVPKEICINVKTNPKKV